MSAIEEKLQDVGLRRRRIIAERALIDKEIAEVYAEAQAAEPKVEAKRVAELVGIHVQTLFHILRKQG